MKKILDTYQINGKASTIIVDLVKNNQGLLSLNIQQSKDNIEAQPSNLDLHHDDITHLIKTLQTCHSLIAITRKLETKHINKEISEKIRTYYFKGVEIPKIAEYLDLPQILIESELTKMNIEFTSNKPPKSYRRKRK